MFHGVNSCVFNGCYASGGVCAAAGPLAGHNKTGPAEKFRCDALPALSGFKAKQVGCHEWPDAAHWQDWKNCVVGQQLANYSDGAILSFQINSSYGIKPPSDYLRLFIGGVVGNPYCPTLLCRVGSPAETLMKLILDHDRVMLHVIRQAATATSNATHQYLKYPKSKNLDQSIARPY